LSRAEDYLLDELGPDEAAAFERAMADDPSLRAEVERLRPVVARLQAVPSEAWEGIQPPPLVLPPGLAAGSPHAMDAPNGAARDPHATDTPYDGSSDPRPADAPPGGAGSSHRARSRPRRRLVLRPALAALCAVVLLGVGVGLGVWIDRDPAPSSRLVLAPVGGLDPQAAGRVSLVSNGVDVRVSGLKPTGRGHFYELWLLGADKRLVGLGSFRVDDDGAATLRLPLPVDPKTFTYFDLSLEPADGDPGHSGVSVLRGLT